MPRRHRTARDDPGSERDPEGSALDGSRPSLPGAVVGGYRLVRVLGEGSRATVHVGFADGSTPDQQPRTTAVKIHHDAVALPDIDREIEALTRARHPHALRLDDLATLPSGRPCLLFERLGPGGLAQLVADRSVISPGEAVTLIAPLASAVDALHRSGVVHGRVRSASVLFRESGAPVLVGFGAATLIEPGQPPAALSGNEGVLADRRQLALVASAVLERVQTDAARAMLAALAHDEVAVDDFGAHLAERLFELAEPEPIRMVSEADAVLAIAAGRSPIAVVPVPVRAAHAEERSGVPGATEALARLAAGLALTTRGFVSGVRPRFWVAGAAVAVSVAVAVVSVPHGESPPGAGATTGDRVSSGQQQGDQQQGDQQQGELQQGELQQGELQQGELQPSDQQPSISRPGDPPPLDPVQGDDPLAALVALLDERQRCLRDLSVLCLDGVLQPGSAALQSDATLVRAIQDGGASPDAAIVASTPVLVERLGDSALVAFGDVPDTQPASALMMRGEAGWRIRDYISE